MPFSHRPSSSPGAQSLTQRSHIAVNRAHMADQLPRLDDDGIEWTKATSGNGVPFEVGIKRTEVKDHREDFKKPTLENYDEFQVNWPVGDDSWKLTSGRLQTWIPRYKLHDNGLSPWKYRLEITSNAGGVTEYLFYDETGDHYSLLVDFKGDHYVRYNSHQPTIVRVKV